MDLMSFTRVPGAAFILALVSTDQTGACASNLEAAFDLYVFIPFTAASTGRTGGETGVGRKPALTISAAWMSTAIDKLVGATRRLELVSDELGAVPWRSSTFTFFLDSGPNGSYRFLFPRALPSYRLGGSAL
jgi:hypothetical protein